ncbi:MAG TPA: hypothetical protein VMT96_00325 [Candidatus Bathyarchaeia archaeon]|nr:hypothetical protein [Candidatus Bathyarchaeia archaeon]
MSERAPSAPAPAEQTPKQAGEQAVDELQAALNNPEQIPDLSGVQLVNELEAKLGDNQQLQAATDEKATWRIRGLNGLNRAQRHARLLSAREWRLEGRVARLEHQLANAKPGSRKHMRIETRLIHSRYRKDKVWLKQEKMFNRMHERSTGYGGEIKKIATIERKREKFLIDRKVALEKKRRRKVKIKYKLEQQATHSDLNFKQKLRKELYSDFARRERLRKEILSWKGNSMVKFEEDLKKKADEKYNVRLKGRP